MLPTRQYFIIGYIKLSKKCLFVFCTFMLIMITGGEGYDGREEDIFCDETVTPAINNGKTTNESTLLTHFMRDGHCEEVDYFHCDIANDIPYLHHNISESTSVGKPGGFRRPCRLLNGSAPTRHCLFRQMFKCVLEPNSLEIHKNLSVIYEQVLKKEHLKGGVEKRRNILEEVQDLLPRLEVQPAHVNIVTQIITQLSNNVSDIGMSRNVLNICNTLMNTNQTVLHLSTKLNDTNVLVKTFENSMDNLAEQLVPQSQCDVKKVNITVSDGEGLDSSMNMSQMGVYAELSSNIKVFYLNPECAEIGGIAIYDADAKSNTRKLYLWQNTGGFKFSFIYFNDTLESLQNEYLQVATFLPKKIWQEVQQKLTKRNRTASLVVKLYTSDALFIVNHTELIEKPQDNVLSISIPDFNEEFSEPLYFLMRNRATANGSQENNTCGYWNYSSWLKDGVYTDDSDSTEGDEKLLNCSTVHLTQFTILTGSYKQHKNETALDDITLIGCMLSLLGLCGIWLSAVFLKKWRSMASTKILLNMCLALTLQMVLILFVNTNNLAVEWMRDHKTKLCIFVGALLQYATLVIFVWMLIVAFLQFQRYVTVIGIQRPDHYILKAALLAWLLPLLPTLLCVGIDSSTYLPDELALQTNTAVCYPSGLGLIMGVVAPVVAVVAANTIIFIYVLYSITHTLQQSLQRAERQMIIKQFRLSVLLFFLLGLSWIFGILNFLNVGVIFSYLFCLTATLQGFVLFIYFVILDEVARTGWLNLLCCGKQKQRKPVPELMSLTTTSTKCRDDSNYY